MSKVFDWKAISALFFFRSFKISLKHKILVIRKKKKKKRRPANGLKLSDFADKDQAEFDEEADLANVSDDEDENAPDEYEEEIITENLPSADRQQKINAKIHQKLQRDEDQIQLKRMEEAFMGDEISQALV